MDINDVENRITENSVQSTDNFNRINKLEQSYFTSGPGIIITDNRKMGMDTIDISIDPSYQTATPRVDMLESQVIELQKMNKVLLEFAREHLNYNSKKPKKQSVIGKNSNIHKTGKRFN